MFNFSKQVRLARGSVACIVKNKVHIAVYSAIIAEDGLQEICIVIVSYNHTVFLTDCSTGERGLGCAVGKAV